MLFSTIIFFKYSELKETGTLKQFSTKDFYEENKEDVHKIVTYNALMLLFGYLGETGSLNKMVSIPIGFVLWYLAYDAKPINNDEATFIWEEEKFVKRSRLLNILKKGF